MNFTASEGVAPTHRKAMNNDMRELCLKLIECESESAVHTLLESDPKMRNPQNWRPLDHRETNFNVTSNQASDGGKALTELMTNMVDAVLMKHALQRGIDPKGLEAPQTMYEAVDKLIKPLHGGKLVNLDPNDPWLRDFASKNLVIGVTGAKNKKEGLPCYTFVDNGEGQRPLEFERTFLSLSEGNKKSIPFVQGKYNMGSSGVLGYCGRLWYKLIVSRRFDGESPWGWTLMRRRPGGGMPVAEYFVLDDGSIPSFTADILHPFTKNDGNRYDGLHLRTGTVVKLYDYQVGSKFLSFKGAREALNENLVETILPFRLLDFRQKPDHKRGGDRAEGIDPRPFYGMEYLLLRAHKEEQPEDDVDEDEEEKKAAGEARISVGKIEDPEIGEISISAIKLKRVLPSWLKDTNNRVFHALNGQVQFKQTRGYLTTCGFPALKDRIVLIVDASNLSEEAHNDVWKGDREHIRNTIVGERYKELITAQIKDSKALKDLQSQVASEEMERAAKSERNDLFQKLVDADRNLAGLLTDRDPEIRMPASGGAKGGDDKGEGKFQGKYSPTYLRIDEKSKLIELPINRRRPVAGRTDAENGYLDRADNCGSVLLPNEVAARFTVGQQLHDGRLTLYFDPLEDQNKVGDKLTFKVGLQDPAMATTVEDELTIVIRDEEVAAPKSKSNPGPKPPNAGEGKDKDKKGEGANAPTHGLPKYRLLTKDGRNVGEQETQAWPDGLNEYDGGVITDLGDAGMLYMINYDNTYHLKYRQQQRGDIARDVVTEKYILGMRILMMGYEHAFRMLRETNGEGIAEYLDEFRRMAARGAASTVLALAEYLPKIVDTSSVNADVE